MSTKLFAGTFTYTIKEYDPDLQISEEEYHHHVQEFNKIVETRRQSTVKFSFIFGIFIFGSLIGLILSTFAILYITKETPEDSIILIVQSLKGPTKKAVALRSNLNSLYVLKDAANSAGVSIFNIPTNPSPKDIDEAFKSNLFLYLDFESTNEATLDSVCSNLKNSNSTFFGRYWSDTSIPNFLSRCSKNMEKIYIPDSFSFSYRVTILMITAAMTSMGAPVCLLIYVIFILNMNSTRGVDYYVKKYNESLNHLKLNFDQKMKTLDFIPNSPGLSQQINEIEDEEFHDQI
jgi:hypothetical protein